MTLQQNYCKVNILKRPKRLFSIKRAGQSVTSFRLRIDVKIFTRVTILSEMSIPDRPLKVSFLILPVQSTSNKKLL